MYAGTRSLHKQGPAMQEDIPEANLFFSEWFCYTVMVLQGALFFCAENRGAGESRAAGRPCG